MRTLCHGSMCSFLFAFHAAYLAFILFIKRMLKREFNDPSTFS